MDSKDFAPFQMEVHINDDEIDYELEHLLDEENGGNKPNAKNKKKAQQPPPKKAPPQKDPPVKSGDPNAFSMEDIEKALKDTDEIQEDDVSLDSDDLALLDGDLNDSKDKSKPNTSQKSKFSKDISSDDEEPVPNAPPPQAKLKPKKTTYKKEQKPERKLTYEDVFDYFSGNFYNFLFSVDEPSIAQKYMTRMEDLVPIVFAGEEKFDPKGVKIDFLSLPKKIVPFGHWTNISSAPLKVDSLITENKNVRKILTDQLEDLQNMKAEANSRREDESVKEIERAIKLTNQSLKAAFPKPEFLVTDYIQLRHSALNTSISDKEIQVLFKSVRNCSSKEKYHITVEIPGIGRFQSRKLSGPNNDNLNDSYNQTYEPKKIQNAVAKGGRVVIGDKNAQFSLAELVHKSTVEINSNVSGAVVSFSVSIRTPLSGDKTTYELKEFSCCPTILTEAVNYAPREEVVVDHTPKEKPKPKPAAPKQNPAPHLVLLSKEECNLFWGTKATECLADKCMINYFQKNKLPLPQEYVDQVNLFNEKMKEFVKMQEDGSLDPMQYLSDLKNALSREQAKLPKIPENDKPFRQLLVKSLQEEVKEIEDMLAGADDEDDE